ncbi:MAG: hypothetical protein QGH25_22985, partial [Candidatus Latescibacteria bacterium]|nr:hypothetical protein [Candidatus Latescibacterota bacterium]
MDQIAQQLKEEILSLQRYIEHTEKRVLAINWVEILLNPFEQVEGEFGEDEIKNVVTALVTARNRFSVNGHLADRVDGIIDHYKHLAIDDLEDEERESLPAKDPALFPSTLGEDEESTDQGPVALSLDDLTENMEDGAGDALAKTDLNDIDTVVSSTAEAPPAEDCAQDHQQLGNRRDNNLDPGARQEQDDGDLQEGNADELFAAAAPNPSPQEPADQPAQAPGLPAGNAEDLLTGPTALSVPPHKRRRKKGPSGESATKIRSRQEATTPSPSAKYNIFAEQADLDALLLDMNIDLPAQDKVQLGHLRKQKLESRSVAALQSNEDAQGKYVLIPRFTRFIYEGSVYN